MKKLRCDKPYDLDEARKKKGLPRRKRKDARTTAYVPSTGAGIGIRCMNILRVTLQSNCPWCCVEYGKLAEHPLGCHLGCCSWGFSEMIEEKKEVAV